MPNTAHTPGPWTQTAHAVQSGYVSYIKGNADHDEVAVLYSDERQAANALLIAAAPDMLDALHECADLLDNYSDVIDGDDGQPRPNRAMSMLTEIERIIRKAEGR